MLMPTEIWKLETCEEKSTLCRIQFKGEYILSTTGCISCSIDMVSSVAKSRWRLIHMHSYSVL